MKWKLVGAFYAEAYNSDFQDYIIAADPWEVTSARAEFDLSTDKSKIKIEKVDEDTKEPISGVTFQLKDEKGTIIQNATTNTEGIATFSKLKPGKYIISEVSTNDNYILNTTEHTINVGYDLTIEKQFTNKHKTGDLKVFKVDADNNKVSLGGVEFELYSEELDKIVGTYKTDENGEILIKDLRTGNYKLIETKTNKWYNLAEDTEIEVKWNNENSTTITNELKKGQIKIVKVDADNNEIKLAGVEFEILDNNNNVLEKVITDENGEALTSRYAVRDYNNLKIREVNTLEDYVLIDDILNVELKANETTSLVIENEHIKGQIEITKVDKDDDSILLEGAEFGLYNENDELIGTLTTDKSGKALSDKLYKGNYYLKELSSGSKYYLLNNETFKFEIANNNEVIPITVENEKVKISVDVEKTGYIETQKNDTIKYDFSNIANTSNIYLDSFKWRDYLPTDYIRLEEIVTGTWNQEITYSITYKTNLINEERILKENLDSKQNYKIDYTDIDLKEGEYITEFCFDFGKVDVGFKEDISPAIFCKVLDNVENKDTFTNKTSTEGEYEDLKDRAEDEWTTIVYEKDVHANKLPKTGF